MSIAATALLCVLVLAGVAALLFDTTAAAALVAAVGLGVSIAMLAASL